eukprot:gene19409-25284_t
MNEFYAGNSLLLDDEIEESIKKFTEGISINSNFSKLYSHRALAYIQSNKFTLALQDCNRALLIDSSDHITVYRKGLACFELGEYEIALKSSELAIDLLSSNKSSASDTAKQLINYQRLLRKCQLQLAEEKESSLIDKTSNLVMTDSSKDQIESNDKNKSFKELSRSNNIIVADSQTNSSQLASRYLETTKYYYCDEDSQIVVSILASVSEDSVKTIITEDHLRVEIQWSDKLEVVLDKELFESIDMSTSRVAVKKNKVNVYLKKIDKRSWPSLERSGEPKQKTVKPIAKTEIKQDNNIESSTKLTIPKAYSSNKDWDRIGTEIVREVEGDAGEDPLKKLFSDIYSKADPDTRRAMNKSFQTSGGTVLSTNWSEVQRADYEKQKKAPKGMEWRSWEGDKLDQVDSDTD